MLPLDGLNIFPPIMPATWPDKHEQKHERPFPDAGRFLMGLPLLRLS